MIDLGCDDYSQRSYKDSAIKTKPKVSWNFKPEEQFENQMSEKYGAKVLKIYKNSIQFFFVVCIGRIQERAKRRG